MTNRTIAFFLSFLLGIACGALACEHLTDDPIVTERIREVVFPGKVDTIVKTMAVRVDVPVEVPVEDSIRIHRILRERDSLRKALVDARVRVSFGADTTTPDGDRYIIDCDETTRTASLVAMIAPRDTTIRDTTTILPVVVEPSRWGLSVGAGAAVSLDGQIRPSLFVGVTYSIFRR